VVDGLLCTIPCMVAEKEIKFHGVGQVLRLGGKASQGVLRILKGSKGVSIPGELEENGPSRLS